MASEKQSRTSKAGQPYYYAEHSLEMSVEKYEFDDLGLGSPSVTDGEADLTGFGNWESLSIEGSVTVTKQTLERVLPESEYESPKLKVLIKIDTLDTQRRLPKEVMGAPLDNLSTDTEWTYDYTCTFESKDVFNQFTLEPRLVRTEDCGVGLPYAPKLGMHVANGEPLTIRLDGKEQSGDGFPSMYQDFSDTDFEHDERLVHVLAGTRADPKVLVNSAHDPILDVLESGRGGGFRPRMRKIVAGDISKMTYVQLLLHTAGTVAENGEPEYNWQRGLVEELGDYLYPEMSANETLVHIGDQVKDPGSLRELGDEMNRALQLYTKQSYNLNNHIKRDS